MSSLTYKANGIEAIKDHVLVKGMEFHERITNGGIIVPGNDGKSEGIKPRWGEVVAIGPEQTDIEVGEWVLVEHGRWTRGMKLVIADEELVLRRVDVNDIILVSDEPQSDETWSTAITGKSDLHRIEGSLHRDGSDDF